MNNNLITKGIILSLLLIFIGLFSSLNFFASAYPTNSYNQPSYYGQYNYRYNYNYGYNNYLYNQGYAVPHFYTRPGNNLFSMPGTPDTQGRITHNSHIYINNALDYTYFTHPELLQPRRMSNHQRYASGLWPQRFWY